MFYSSEKVLKLKGRQRNRRVGVFLVVVIVIKSTTRQQAKSKQE